MVQSAVFDALADEPESEDTAPTEDCYVFPASFAQQRLWVLDQMQPGAATYNMALEVRLSGPLDARALTGSLNMLVARHEALRTTVATEDGQPVQVIASSLDVPLPLLDLTDFAEEQREEQIARIAREEAQRPFDLAAGPLLRARLLRLEAAEHVLLVTMHHIISDGWSTGVLLRELGACYAAEVAGEPANLPELPIQYADFSQWQREWLQGDVLEKQFTYWRQQLAGAPTMLELPADRPRPATQTYHGAMYRFALPAHLTRELRRLSQREGVTLFMTLLAAFQTLLARYTAQDDMVVGSPIAGRARPETEGLIGFFINMLVLRTDLSGNPTFRDLLRRVREVAVGAYAHQDLPFERLVEELHPERDPRFNPLFQVVFVLQNALAPTEPCAGVTFRARWLDTGTAKFDLTLNVMESADTLEAWIEYSTDLFDAQTIARMSGHFQRLLEGIAANPQQRLSALPLLSEAERHQVLDEWNATTTSYPREATIAELFEAQVAATPDAIAVEYDEQRLTYRELNRRANQVAAALRRLGVGPDLLVGTCIERSLELVVGLLGILKAGGAYVPLDPSYPPERLALMLEDAPVPVLLAQEALLAQLPLAAMAHPAHSMRVLCLDRDWDAIIGSESDENQPCNAGAESLAYISFTSGSTGRPKGVAIPQRGVVRLVKETNFARLSAGEVFAQLAPVAFDASTLELWGALLNGARLVVFPAHTPSLAEVGAVLRRSGVTTLWLTAGLFHQMVEEQLEGLAGVRQLLAGGDVLSPAHVRTVLREVPGCTLINGYGPTEGTTFTCCWPMTTPEQVGESVPIGRPIANTRVYILDGQMQPVPVGVPGELYIGGDGLARGYIGRPELTAERFVPHPFAATPGERLYRTGDRVRWLADGTIEFLGRVDMQVKLRGFRIEPGEIEAVLRQHPGVRAATVLAREDTPGDKRLVAYLVPDAADTPPDIGALRHVCKEKLPDYMVPAAFVLLDTLPLTPNGKVDRRALPAPDRTHMEIAAAHVAPRTDVEQQLTGIWEDLLGIHPIGVQDNFFELGGHSLLAARLMARIQKAFGINLPLSLLFERATVEGLASSIERPDVPERWSSLVAIRPAGTKPPFFCVHGIFGDVLFYADLVRYLDADRPLYGLQARGLDGTQEPFSRFEPMAAAYIEEIRAVQPEGPYYLGGYSSGASVAYEMARQLVASGQEVALVALFDHANPSSQYERMTWNKRFPLRFLRNLAVNLPYWLDMFLRGNSDQRLKLALQRAQIARRALGALVKYRGYVDSVGDSDTASYVDYLRATPGLEYVNEWPEYRFKVLDCQRRALMQYVPGEYAGRVTLLRARRQPIFCSHDPLMGWESVARGGVEVIEVPGSHHSILHDPYAREFAAALHRCWSRFAEEAASS